MAQRENSPLDWLRGHLPHPRPRDAATIASVAIVTDSAAALPQDWLQTLPDDGLLTVVPMPLMVGGEIFGEGDEDVGAALPLALAAGQPVRTSRPSPGLFDRALAAAGDAGYTAAVVVALSGELSGTVEAAILAAGRAAIPVVVIDSRTAGMAQGFAVQAAYAIAANGGSVDEAADAARHALAGSEVYFYVPSLDQLRRGGRIGLAASWLGTVFAIKPILSIRNGLVVPLERIRQASRAISRLEEIVAADIASRPEGTVAVAVHHFGNEAAAVDLARRLRAASPRVGPVSLSELPAVLAAHVGLGVLAVVVCGPPAEPGSPPQPGVGSTSAT